MPLRTDLQNILQGIIGSGKVYFQPPATISMTYPCIVYEISNADTKFADNKPYHWDWRYTVTVITKDPDSNIPNKLAALPSSTFDRHFTVDNLHHTVFNMYY